MSEPNRESDTSGEALENTYQSSQQHSNEILLIFVLWPRQTNLDTSALQDSFRIAQV